MADLARIAAIKAELDADPLGRLYSGMDDPAVTADLNTVYRTRTKASVSGADAFQVTDPDEFDALLDPARSEWLSMCAIESLNPANGTPAAAIATRLFGGPSATVAALIAFREETVTRGVELGFGLLSIGDIQNARAI